MGGTFLAHWLGVIGTEEQLSGTMVEQSTTVLTQHQFLVTQNLTQFIIFGVKDISVFLAMILPTEDGYEIAQDPQILGLILI